MFPFYIRGKVPLGQRKDYHISAPELEERISRRLVKSKEKKGPEIHDGLPRTTGGKGLLAEGVSRLKSMGFLSTVTILNLRVVEKQDILVARYTMDATATTLVSAILLPLILGTALLSRADLSPVFVLSLLAILVLTTWGMDIYILISLVRHEIRATATEIRNMIVHKDQPVVEELHLDLEPEILLSIAFFYERNGHLMRTFAYLDHLVEFYPDSTEAELARKNLERLRQRLDFVPEPPRHPELARRKRRVKNPWRKKEREPEGRRVFYDGSAPRKAPVRKRRSILGRIKDRLLAPFRKRRSDRSGPSRERLRRESRLEKTHRWKRSHEPTGQRPRRRWRDRLRYESRRERESRRRWEKFNYGPEKPAPKRTGDRVSPPEKKVRFWNRRLWPSREERRSREMERRWREGPVRKEPTSRRFGRKREVRPDTT